MGKPMTSAEAGRWVPDPDNVLEQWEDVAEWFYRETFFLRPGKSYPLGAAPDEHERQMKWDAWCKEKQRAFRDYVFSLSPLPPRDPEVKR